MKKNTYEITYAEMTDEMKKRECKKYIKLFSELDILKQEAMVNTNKMLNFFNISEGNPIRMIELITREEILGF